MSFLYVWHSVPVNKSKRPFLTDNEHHIFVKDGVGIYQGKLKIRDFQNGRVYLTNKRVIYLDSVATSKALAVNLSDVSNAETVEKFLRSSPKVKIFIKPETAGDPGNDENVTSKSVTLPKKTDVVDWVCGICSFNNHLSTDTNLKLGLPKCVSCGIPPSQTQLENVLRTSLQSSRDSASSNSSEVNSDLCPKCTFINHPSMRFCELCGAPLKLASSSVLRQIKASEQKSAAESNPLGLVLEDAEIYTNLAPYVKISFRKGGEAEFYAHLREIIDKMKWDALEAKGGISGDSTKMMPIQEQAPRIQSRGIQGLVKTGELQRKQNERVLSLSLEDLEQLMHKAQEILELTSSFKLLVKKQYLPTVNIPPLLVNLTLSIYHQELAQHMSEYLINAELPKASSMITTQDFFASYNRYTSFSQGFGSELVSTQDFQKSLQLFESLSLPVKLKTFSSGLVVITQRLHDLQDIHQVVMEHLVAEENRFMYDKYTSEYMADTDGYMENEYRSFRGKTVAEIAEHFGWSAAICAEEITRCIEERLVVYDKHVLGTFYFVNRFDVALLGKIQDEEIVREKAHQDVLRQQKLISSNLRSQQEIGQNLLALHEFDFGAISSAVDENKSEESSNTEEPISESMSLLSGLKF